MRELGPIRCPTSFLDFAWRWTERRVELWLCPHGNKISVATILRTSNPAGTLSAVICFLPWGWEESSCTFEPATGHWGHVATWGKGQYSTSYLKLTSEYLSMLHQPALLTPKSGLWEKSNCLLWVTPGHVSDKVICSHFVIMCPNGRRNTLNECLSEWMNAHQGYLY